MCPTEIKKNCQRIPTGLPSPKGEVIIKSVIGQLSDGMWENSIQMEGYWKFVCIETTPELGVTICVSNETGQWSYGYTRRTNNRFYGKGDTEILKWFAEKIRQVAKAEEGYYPNDEFRIAKGNKGISKFLGGSGNELTGDDVWSLRKTLLDTAKHYWEVPTLFEKARI